MFNISNFLEKFSKSVFSGEEKKKILVQIIYKHTGCTVLVDDIEIRGNTLYISVSPGIKNKIFMYKDTICEQVSTSLGVKISAIR